MTTDGLNNWRTPSTLRKVVGAMRLGGNHVRLASGMMLEDYLDAAADAWDDLQRRFDETAVDNWNLRGALAKANRENAALRANTSKSVLRRLIEQGALDP